MGWKIYFFIFTILVLIAYALIFTGSPVIWDYIDTIESTFVLVGLSAYAFKKQIGTPQLWKYLLFVFIGWDITYNLVLSSYLGVAQQVTVENASISNIEVLIGWVIIFPAYYAIYKLGFASVSNDKENT